MVSNNLKQRARARRERKFRRRLATLSWTLPVVAFGGFFSIWHNVSAAVTPPAKAKPNVAVVTKHPKHNTTTSVHAQASKSITPSILFKIGSKGPQVSVIQEQLSELGYFHHVITEYYGPVTSHAVESFQTAQHLPATGEIDSATLTALQKAAKHHQTTSLVRSSPSSAPVTSNSKHTSAVSTVSSHHSSSISANSAPKSTQTNQQTTAPSKSTAAVSQQSIPQTSSSAS